MKKTLLPVAWSLSILLLVLLASFMSGESDHFYGIAEDQEQTISFELPVEIVRTLVVEGEIVKRGDLLMEVRSEGLQSSLAVIEDELQELISQDEVNIATLNSRLVGLKAKQEAQRADLDSQINGLKSRYELNKAFMEQMSESDPEKGIASADTKPGPLLEEIKGLKIQRRHLMESSQAEIDNIELQLSASERPVDARISGLEVKKKEALRQLVALKIHASSDGRVGSILFKAGETVSPYHPVLTVHGSSPSYIKAYISEHVINKIQLGQKVWVQSATALSGVSIIEGTVESLGSRIVEYPERLRRSPFVSAWGRETIIHLTETPSLLLGEKVVVQLKKPTSLFATLFTSSAAAAAVGNRRLSTSVNGIPVYSKDDTSPVFSSSTLLDVSLIEASGISRSPEGAGYLLIGDEANDGVVDLYRLNGTGDITEKVVVKFLLSNTPKIDDLESISSEGKYIYLCASLSRNKQREIKDRRQRLMRLERRGSEIIYRGHVDLFDYLENLSNLTGDEKTKRFLKRALASQLIDIESHSVIDGNLYIGFKAPIDENRSTVILKLGSVNGILSGKQAEGKIWKTLDLQDRETGEITVLTDMFAQEGKLLLLSVNENRRHPVSHLWSFEPDTDSLLEIAVFSDLKAEGIAGSGGNDGYMVVFDGGGGTASRYMHLKAKKRVSTGSR